jgi:rRNA maturation protein Nop10
MKIVGKCPKCKKYSFFEVNEREIAGISKCRRHVINRYHLGAECPLCGYHNRKSEIR